MWPRYQEVSCWPDSRRRYFTPENEGRLRLRGASGPGLGLCTSCVIKIHGHMIVKLETCLSTQRSCDKLEIDGMNCEKLCFTIFFSGEMFRFQLEKECSCVIHGSDHLGASLIDLTGCHDAGWKTGVNHKAKPTYFGADLNTGVDPCCKNSEGSNLMLLMTFWNLYLGWFFKDVCVLECPLSNSHPQSNLHCSTCIISIPVYKTINAKA